MKIKVDWLTWLHTYKEREINTIFSACPVRCFECGLELGAGDGFQSLLLSRYVVNLMSTEINSLTLVRKSSDSIEYKVLSAEEAVGESGDKSVDIVFSSNLLEHVLDPTSVLRGIHRILKDDGITIHIMPSPLWKMSHLLFYVPANALAIIEQVASQRGLKNRVREIRYLLSQFITGLETGSNAMIDRADVEDLHIGNNPHGTRKQSSFLKRLMFPQPHGISATNLAEFAAFSRRRWIRAAHDAGFDLIALRKGPAASGYALGWNWAEHLIEKIGLASEWIYIAQKKGQRSRFIHYFL
jgi:SAM-dependent methyltransferase